MRAEKIKSYYNIHTSWVAMLLLTLSTFAMGKMGYQGLGIVLLLFATVLIKGIFIIRDFMELNGVSLLWRIIMYSWLWIITGAIAISYLISL